MAIRSEVEKITPEIAERILDASKEQVRNRKVHDSHVSWLAEQMKAGKWQTNGEPIILDDEGFLMDGQHRLYAIALSGVAVETVVTRGVDRKTFATIDTGAGRTMKDVLSILDESNSGVTATTLGWLYRYEQGKMLWSLKLSGFTSQLGAALLKKHPEIRESISWATNTVKDNIILGKIAKAPLAFLKYVFTAHKPNFAGEFFELVGEIRPDHPGTPTRVMRDWIIKDERSRSPASSLETMAVLVKAWTAFLAGGKPMTYVWRRTGAMPESFPRFPGENESRGKAIRGMKPKDGRSRKERSYATK